MDLEVVVTFSLVSLGTALLVKPPQRKWVIMGASVLVLYRLQPGSTLRHMDFWIPTATLVVIILSWVLTLDSSSARQQLRSSRGALAALGALVLLVATLRYAEPVCCLTATRPPAVGWVVLVITGVGLSVIALQFLSGASLARAMAIGILVLIMVVPKAEPVGASVSAWLRQMAGQDPAIASSRDLAAIGFSYIAFRLIHTLLDRTANRLPAAPLSDYVAYATFFPALIAGPINRSQPFLEDLANADPPSWPAFVEGGRRILLGVFKKVLLADVFALFALDAVRASQSRAGLWAWILLYAYSMRIYFDFSALTDIAIGLGQWMGIRLPENFNRPYAQSSLTAFWNSWHITLAQWIRAYFFNPVTRLLRGRGLIQSTELIVLAGQLSAMLLIGAWHGLTVNFAVWGLWHGVGLFIDSRWREFRRRSGQDRPSGRWSSMAGTLVTFHFVTLGWVWFALPDPQASLDFLGRLFGVP